MKEKFIRKNANKKREEISGGPALTASLLSVPLGGVLGVTPNLLTISISNQFFFTKIVLLSTYLYSDIFIFSTNNLNIAFVIINGWIITIISQ